MPSRFENFAFTSTGNPEQDARIAADFRRHEALESEGLCPNGCGPIVWDDPHNRHCPACRFVGWCNVPYGGRPPLIPTVQGES